MSKCCSVLQAPNEELYDIIQVNPTKKPVAAVRALKGVQSQHVVSEQTPRPPKSNRTLEVSTVHTPQISQMPY